MIDQNDTAARVPDTLPVPLGPSERQSGSRSDTAFSAQLLGHGGQKRGLRGGTPVLQAPAAPTWKRNGQVPPTVAPAPAASP